MFLVTHLHVFLEIPKKYYCCSVMHLGCGTAVLSRLGRVKRSMIIEHSAQSEYEYQEEVAS